MTTINGVLVALPPPEGYVVDFDNPQRNSVLGNYLAAGIGMTFALFFLSQRIYVKAFIHRSLGIDDYFVIAAWAFSVAMQGLVIYGFVEGRYGVHAWEIPFEMFEKTILYANYIQALVYVWPTMFSKLALLVFYLKLQNREMWYQISVWFSMFVVAGSQIGIFFSVAFACKPIAMAYKITITDGTCIDRAAVFKATAAFGIVTDVLIFLIPIPMVIRLHLSRQKKAGLMLLFTIGSATVVTSIVRLVQLMRNLVNPDTTWIGGPIFLWICVEANLLVICACLPTLKFFVQTVAPKILGTSSIPGGQSNSNTAGWQSGGYHRNGGVSTTNSTRPKPKKEHYNDFDGDHDYRMETLVERGDPVGRHRSPSDQDIAGDKDRDDDSAKAIIETKTLQIYYEDRAV